MTARSPQLQSPRPHSNVSTEGREDSLFLKTVEITHKGNDGCSAKVLRTSES